MHPTSTRTRLTPTRLHRHGKSRGQSVAEFALLLPVLLAFLGLTIDFARVYQAWITLESATRDAAEYAATTGTSSSDATTKAKKTICLQSQDVPGFTKSGLASPNDVEQCTAPNVSVVSFGLSTNPAVGASPDYPIGSATVQATLPFRPLISWPFITQNGQWIITSRATFSVVQNRE